MYRLPVYRLQMVKERTLPAETCGIRTPDDAAGIFAQFLQHADREHFCLLLLDTKGRVTGVHNVAVGDLSSCLVSPRDVFKAALLANAASIIVGHNHPSGMPEPSPEDIAVTRRLKEAGELIGVEVLDHIVIGDDGRFVSIKGGCASAPHGRGMM